MKKKEQVRDEQQGIVFHTKEIKKSDGLNEDTKRALSLLIIFLVMGIAICLLFFLNGKFVTKDLFVEKTTTTTTVTVNEKLIVMDDIFKKNDKEYMVMVYDSKDDKESILYGYLINAYDGKTPLYVVDLADKTNSNYYNKTGKENTKPAKLSDIVITKSTLITIKDGKVSSYNTNKDTINDKLK